METEAGLLSFRSKALKCPVPLPGIAMVGASALACYFVLWTAAQSYDTSIVPYAGLEDQSMVHPGKSQGPWVSNICLGPLDYS